LQYWQIRDELSRNKKIRRTYYKILRDELESFLLKYALLDSYENFQKENIPYPFVEKRELKPRAIIPNIEHKQQNTCLVIFSEESLPESYKKYLRFLNINKAVKKNLIKLTNFAYHEKFDRSQKYFESPNFFDFLYELLPIDYALLIQPEFTKKEVNKKYSLSHFHIKIDWPIAEAAEALAKSLRYISQDLYEKGDNYAENIQKKFFEYYGLSPIAGGRRTAAVVASQFLRKLPFISTIYASSSESRALLRFSENGISNAVIMNISNEQIKNIAEQNKITIKKFKENYMIAKIDKEYICIFVTIYDFTEHSRPPYDGKLRELKSDLNWLTVSKQLILPKTGKLDIAPLPANLIYS
jgi:hypothetical protein